MMVNGAFFVPSGEGMEDIYQKASSIDPKSSALVDQLTIGAGVLGGPRYVPFSFLPSISRSGLTRRLHASTPATLYRSRYIRGVDAS